MMEFRISVPPNIDKFGWFLGVLVFWNGWLKEVAIPGGLRFSITGGLVPIPLCVREI